MYYPGLEGKNVLLIGGHSNLGQHVTQLFAESGANIVIAARDLKRAHQVAGEARRFEKGKVSVVEVDATNWNSLENAIAATRELGSLDVLYHGVGFGVHGSFLQVDPKLWDTMYECNFKSLMMAWRIALPIMIEQKSGCCIALGSVMGRRAAPIQPVYGALKCGLVHLAQTLAHDVAPHGVRINIVAPGPTPPQELSRVSANSSFRGMMQDMDRFKAATQKVAEDIPLKRLGEPSDVAHAVLFLASPVTGAFQTGQVLGVDGGWWMPK